MSNVADRTEKARDTKRRRREEMENRIHAEKGMNVLGAEALGDVLDSVVRKLRGSSNLAFVLNAMLDRPEKLEGILMGIRGETAPLVLASAFHGKKLRKGLNKFKHLKQNESKMILEALVPECARHASWDDALANKGFNLLKYALNVDDETPLPRDIPSFWSSWFAVFIERYDGCGRRLHKVDLENLDGYFVCANAEDASKVTCKILAGDDKEVEFGFSEKAEIEFHDNWSLQYASVKVMTTSMKGSMFNLSERFEEIGSRFMDENAVEWAAMYDPAKDNMNATSPASTPRTSVGGSTRVPGTGSGSAAAAPADPAAEAARLAATLSGTG